MDINSIANYTQTYGTSDSSSTSGMGSLGKDDFLKILVAQLQNQDPTQPMSDTEFIGQMAQFSTLEQMQQMTQMFSYTQAYSLVGKNITASVTDDSGATQQLTGNVDSVITYNGEPYLMVAGYMLPLSTPMSVNGTGSADSLLQGASLIGRTVTGYYLDEDNAVQKVTGQVTKAALVNGELTLTVNGIAVNINNVTEIADGSDTNAG